MLLRSFFVANQRFSRHNLNYTEIFSHLSNFCCKYQLSVLYRLGNFPQWYLQFSACFLGSFFDALPLSYGYIRRGSNPRQSAFYAVRADVTFSRLIFHKRHPVWALRVPRIYAVRAFHALKPLSLSYLQQDPSIHYSYENTNYCGMGLNKARG